MLSRFESVARYFDRLDTTLGFGDAADRQTVPFSVGARFVSTDLDPGADVGRLIEFIDDACRDPGSFYRTGSLRDKDYVFQGGLLTFPSAFATDVAQNNQAYGHVRMGSIHKPAVVILRHWSAADDSYQALAKIINFLGFTTVLATLPFHGRRNRPGAAFSDDFLSANLGRSIASVRQAVSDVRRAMDWLQTKRHDKFILIGASLGTCVASMSALVDVRVSAAALLLTAGDFAEVVWTGDATRHIRLALQESLSLAELQSAWRIMSPGAFTRLMSKREARLLLISAGRDTVVFPEYTRKYVAMLKQDDVLFEEYILACGHYTMAVAPFSVLALGRLIRFLKDCA
jgi:pimeloyl-ACP methyl ester carboxylesterase